MKKLAVVILACIYLVVSTGATIHLHYCMGELVEVSLTPKTAGECSKCGMMKDKSNSGKGCCNDEQQTIKLYSDQKTTASVLLIPPPLIALPIEHIITEIPLLSPITEMQPAANAPPRSSKVALHIRNSIFLI
jgi:hypothetical protein